MARNLAYLALAAPFWYAAALAYGFWPAAVMIVLQGAASALLDATEQA